jgi:hypothetical protein
LVSHRDYIRDTNSVVSDLLDESTQALTGSYESLIMLEKAKKKQDMKKEGVPAMKDAVKKLDHNVKIGQKSNN